MKNYDENEYRMSFFKKYILLTSGICVFIFFANITPIPFMILIIIFISLLMYYTLKASIGLFLEHHQKYHEVDSDEMSGFKGALIFGLILILLTIVWHLLPLREYIVTSILILFFSWYMWNLFFRKRKTYEEFFLDEVENNKDISIEIRKDMPNYVYEFAEEWSREYYQNNAELAFQVICIFLEYYYTDGNNFKKKSTLSLNDITPESVIDDDFDLTFPDDKLGEFLSKLYYRFRVKFIDKEIKTMTLGAFIENISKGMK